MLVPSIMRAPIRGHPQQVVQQGLHPLMRETSPQGYPQKYLLFDDLLVAPFALTEEVWVLQNSLKGRPLLVILHELLQIRLP